MKCAFKLIKKTRENNIKRKDNKKKWTDTGSQSIFTADCRRAQAIHIGTVCQSTCSWTFQNRTSLHACEFKTWNIPEFVRETPSSFCKYTGIRAKTIVPAIRPRPVRTMQMPNAGTYGDACLEQDSVLFKLEKINQNDSLKTIKYLYCRKVFCCIDCWSLLSTAICCVF